MKIDPRDELTNFINKFIRDRVATNLPGRVVNVSNFGTLQMVDVTIEVARLYTDGEVTSHKGQVIYNVPVVFPASGPRCGLTIPVEVGDTVLLVFGMRDMESWLLGDGTEEAIPTSSRHYDITDAIAIPGLFTVTTNMKPHTRNIELRFNDATISITPEGDISLVNASGSVTLGVDGEIDLQNESGGLNVASGGVVTINGVTISTSGEITASKVTAPSIVVGTKELATHTHSAVTPGGGVSGPPV
jgi:Phage protein Gp138 N-terminal domain